MAITNQLEIVQPWESLSVCFLTEANLEIFKKLSQPGVDVWHCGDITEGRFCNPNLPHSNVRGWVLTPTDIFGLIDLHCQDHLFCFMLDEISESHPCPVSLDGDTEKVNLRLCEWLKGLIEEV